MLNETSCIQVSAFNILIQQFQQGHFLTFLHSEVDSSDVFLLLSLPCLGSKVYCKVQ